MVLADDTKLEENWNVTQEDLYDFENRIIEKSDIW